MKIHIATDFDNGIKADVFENASGKFSVIVTDTDANEQLSGIRLFPANRKHDAIGYANLCVS